MMLMAVPAMLMTTACESMDDTNVDPTRMNSANAGSFMDPLIMAWAPIPGPGITVGLSN